MRKHRFFPLASLLLAAAQCNMYLSVLLHLDYNVLNNDSLCERHEMETQQGSYRLMVMVLEQQEKKKETKIMMLLMMMVVMMDYDVKRCI